MLSSLFGSSLKIKPSDFPMPVLDETPSDTGLKQAVLAGGCFWCTEAVYRELRGVVAVVSGYSGGSAKDANYDAVCTGRSAHAEVIQISYDPKLVRFGTLLRVFFSVAHDPTQVNRQGNDVGTQYRSAIFYANDEQAEIARAYIAQLEAAQVFSAPIATRLEPLEAFFDAEPYHQNYAALHPNQGYIAGVSRPKVEKLRAYFADALKRS